MVLYRYGAMAWVWRVLIGLGLAAGAFLTAAGVRLGSPVLILVGLPLWAPGLFFGLVVVVAIDRLDGHRISAESLLFWRRVLPRERLGPGKVFLYARGRVGRRWYAPRAWVGVRGRLPVYVDLLGQVPDRKALAAALGIAAWWNQPC